MREMEDKKNDTDINPRIRYILEETTGVPFLNGQSVYIVYPKKTAKTFILALELLNDLEQKSLHDVKWMVTPIDELSLRPHVSTFNHMTSLFKEKEKHLYFIICPYQPHYTFEHLTILLNMFATAIADCVELVNQERSNEEISVARGAWHITLVVADTLQAYNDKNYLINEIKIKEVVRKAGSKIMEDAKNFILSDKFIGKYTVKESIHDEPDHKNLKLTAGKDISMTVNIMNWEKHRSLNNKYTTDYKIFCDLYRDTLSTDLKDGLSQKIVKFKKKVDEFRKAVDLLKIVYDERVGTDIDLIEEADKLNDSVGHKGKKDNEQQKKEASPHTTSNKHQWVFYNDPEQDKLNNCQRLSFIKTCILGLNPDYTMNNHFKITQLRNHETFLFNLPTFDKTPHVIRKDLIQKLEDILLLRPNAHEDVSIVVCHGQGGVGKSHLTSHYLMSSELDYTMRIRINAGNLDCQTDYRRLAQNLKMHSFGQNLQLSFNKAKQPSDEEIREVLLTWFEDERNAGWILLFDNVVNYDELKKYIPRFGGHVIITSQQKPPNNNWGSITIDVMNDKEAIELLQKSSGRNDLDFRELANKLGNFTLALIWAGAYLNQHPQTKISTYIEEFNQDCLKFMGNNKFSRENRTVAATFRMSLRKIKVKFGDKFAELMKELLNVCAYLASDDIPISILFLRFCLKYNNNDEIVTRFFNLIDQMAKHSLIKYDISSSSGRTLFNSLSIHSVFQEVLRAEHKLTFNHDKVGYSRWLDNISITIVILRHLIGEPAVIVSRWSYISNYFLKNYEKLCYDFKSYYESVSRKRNAIAMLLPHCVTLKYIYNRYDLVSLRLFDLNILIGDIQQILGKYDVAIEAYEKEFNLLKSLNITNSFVPSYRNQNENLEFLSLLELETADQTKFQNCLMQLISERLTMSYSRLGQFSMAAWWLDRCTQPAKENAENLSIYDSETSIQRALYCMKFGEIDKGIQIFERIYPVIESFYGKSSVKFASVTAQIADIYWIRNPIRAKELAENAVRVLKIGTDCKATFARRVLAKALKGLGRIKEAITLIERTISEIKCFFPDCDYMLQEIGMFELMLVAMKLCLGDFTGVFQLFYESQSKLITIFEDHSPVSNIDLKYNSRIEKHIIHNDYFSLVDCLSSLFAELYGFLKFSTLDFAIERELYVSLPELFVRYENHLPMTKITSTIISSKFKTSNSNEDENIPCSKILKSLNTQDPAQEIRRAAASVERDPSELDQLLLAYPTLINEADKLATRYTALHCAVDKGNYKAVIILLAADAKMDIPDALGKTALQHAVEKWQKDDINVDILNILLGKMIDEFESQYILEKTLNEFESQYILEQTLNEFILPEEDSKLQEDDISNTNNLNPSIQSDTEISPNNNQLTTRLVSAHIVAQSMSKITNPSLLNYSVEAQSRKQCNSEPTNQNIRSPC